MNETTSGLRKFLVVVDDTPECRLALRFAARRAKHTGGGMTFLRVNPPADFQHWIAVEERMRDEAMEESEQLLQTLATEVHEFVDIRPELVVREGDPRDMILALIEEDPDIRILVLAAAAGSEGPGPLVSVLAGKMAGAMHIPVTVVPGNLTESQIDELT
jgi:nucleotide-binding universal stress UspA family protein